MKTVVAKTNDKVIAITANDEILKFAQVSGLYAHCVPCRHFASNFILSAFAVTTIGHIIFMLLRNTYPFLFFKYN